MATRTRKPAGARRDEIVEKAIEAFAAVGFQEASFQRIADALGVSQSAVLHHFRSKEALLEEALKRIVAHNHELVQQTLKPKDDALTILRKHFAANLEWAVDFRPEAQIILMLYAMAGHSPALGAFYQLVVGRGRERVVGLVAAAVRERTFRADTPVDEIGVALHDMLVGAIIAVICLPQNAAEFRRTRKRWEGAFAVWLRTKTSPAR